MILPSLMILQNSYKAHKTIWEAKQAKDNSEKPNICSGNKIPRTPIGNKIIVRWEKTENSSGGRKTQRSKQCQLKKSLISN